MASSSQTVKEILESFKARVDARLEVLAQGLTDNLTNIITYGLNDSFQEYSRFIEQHAGDISYAGPHD
jgi:hypothetical protein